MEEVGTDGQSFVEDVTLSRNSKYSLTGWQDENRLLVEVKQAQAHRDEEVWVVMIHSMANMDANTMYKDDEGEEDQDISYTDWEAVE
ncbi:hypothetical protein P7K49_030910 [Saguinus oedipus]|uniref:Uncharacterized protein n=1 Tax=Saguinus oedipus TaxID=9490 RepID=A0ABQ9U490_SAGOE|nr:hypothetical protein P7K49_030910 [Saguinus oedipus]